MTEWHRQLNPLRWSLKGQIRALSVMVFATVVMSVVLGVLLLQQSQSLREADASRHLAQAANHLAERYESLHRSFAERHADDPLESGDEPLLHSLTEAILAGVPGIEGGFYRAADGRFLGYAYLTYPGSGPKTDIPLAELPTIERVVEAAVNRQGPAEERVSAGTDLILFRARPLFDAARPVAASWVMQRLSGIRSTQQQLYSLGLIGLLVLSGAITAAAWLFTPTMRELFKLIGKVAPSEAAVLIAGESGIGKELVAQAIHRHSPGAHRPLVRVNCAAIPETLLESERFGHERGAFTGASQAKPGRVELADGGTLFRDEVGDLPLSVQVKLLRVLQERTFDRLGGKDTIRADFRLVASTNRDLQQFMAEGRFRVADEPSLHPSDPASKNC